MHNRLSLSTTLDFSYILNNDNFFGQRSGPVVILEAREELKKITKTWEFYKRNLLEGRVSADDAYWVKRDKEWLEYKFRTIMDYQKNLAIGVKKYREGIRLIVRNFKNKFAIDNVTPAFFKEDKLLLEKFENARKPIEEFDFYQWLIELKLYKAVIEKNIQIWNEENFKNEKINYGNYLFQGSDRIDNSHSYGKAIPSFFTKPFSQIMGSLSAIGAMIGAEDSSLNFCEMQNKPMEIGYNLELLIFLAVSSAFLLLAIGYFLYRYMSHVLPSKIEEKALIYRSDATSTFFSVERKSYVVKIKNGTHKFLSENAEIGLREKTRNML